MPWEIAYVESESIVTAKSSGLTTISELDAMLAAVVQEANRHGSRRYLLDYTDSQAPGTVLNVYDRPAAYERVGLPRSARIAVIAPPSFNQQKFSEDVAHNSGYRLRYFDEPEAAMDWLRGS